MTISPPSAVDIRGASQTYESHGGAVAALDAVNLTIERGTVVSLVGPSGCGKSTLLKMIAGLLEPTTGTIHVNETPAAAGRADCGIMLQSPVMLPWRSVLQNVMLPIEVLGLDRAVAKTRAIALLKLVGLEGFENKRPWQLSGGMQQRASLARLLVFEPDILLMDEPFAALDEFTRERLDQEVAQLQQALHRTIIYVTHNITEAVMLSDEVIVMTPRPGRIIDHVVIDLPKPRTVGVMESREAIAFVSRIRRALTRHSEESAQ
jgi:NitT/TauT family transport system ATP-binding protein